MGPWVSVVMGSDSDLEVMSGACRILDEFKVPFELRVVSAHRSPEKMQEFALKAQKRGVRVLIAGAGGAAHLPGMLASLTTLPVIGVPVPSKAFSGLDSLLSIVEMPKGVPVATVGVGNGANGALLALRILAQGKEAQDLGLVEKLKNYRQAQKEKVEAMNRGLSWGN